MQTHTLSWPRFCGAVVFSAVMTCALMWLMQDLIKHTGDVTDAKAATRFVSFVPLIEDEPAIPRPKKIELEPVEPPPVTKFKPTFDPEGDGWDPQIPPPIIDVPPGPIEPTMADNNVLPLFKVAPQYPRTAASRGVEGYVILRFTVDELGRVLDPVVVEANPRGFFEHSALDALLRFKYQPRILNGAPIRVTGMLHRITYELSGA